MKYSLQLFDNLIEDFGEEDNEEVRAIIDEIKKTACSLKTREETRLYIQNHQVALLEQKNFGLLCQKCDSVLHFLETYFGQFINEALPLSETGRSKIFGRFDDLISEISCKIKEIDKKLYGYMQPLTDPDNDYKCTIYSSRYVSCFWESWLSDVSSSGFDKETILNFLITQNYNTPGIFRYITGEIIGELQEEDDPYFQKQVLLSHHKKLSIIPEKNGTAFRPNYPGIKSLLSDWLKAEIKHCRKKLKSYNPQQQTIHTKDPQHKIETSLSVAQTAYLFKILHKTGVLTNKVQMEILHVISEKFRSKKTESISFDSLHNKYYNVEDRTKEAVKDMLREVLKNIQ